MSQKTYLRILKLGIYASLFVVFFVFKSLLFPYITSKQIMFNLLVEALFIFWVAFIVKYPEYRPKWSYITIGLGAFLAALTVSSIFGLDFNLSFWGDVERMLGVFHVLHFFAFYLIVITVFREWKDWKTLFILSLGCAVFVSFFALGKSEISTIGNSAYVSGYLIFNMYFAFLLFFREKNPVLRWSYLTTIIPMLMAFKAAGTSGAYVGLGFSVFIVLLMYALLTKHKKVRLYSLAAFVIVVAFSGFVLVNKNEDWVRNNSVLAQARDISFQKDTFQTRLISWRAALTDFKEHPILGTGFGNFAVIFDKHFTPTFYDFTRGETYFDRAHNNVIDIGSTAGLLGLTTYLSIFAAVAYYLIQGYRRDRIGLHEFILLSGLLIAYFVQNLAVFDSLVTYMALMATLGFIFWLERPAGERTSAKDKPLSNPEIYALAGAGIILIVVMHQFNIKPLQMLVGTIDGQRAWAQGQVKETADIYREALSLNTVLDRDSRMSFNRLFAGNPDALNSLDRETAQSILDYNIELAEANVKYNESDSLNQMMLAQILNAAASYNRNDPEKFAFYSDRSLEAIDKSIAASPGRVPIYYQKSQIYITRGDQENAIATLKYAYDLHPPYYDSACYLGRTYLFYQNEAEGFKYIDECIDLGGASLLAPESYVKTLINHYAEAEDMDRTIALYDRLLALEPSNTDNWIKAAKLYAENGLKDKAIAAARKAGELNPGFKRNVDEFIAGLE